MNEYKILQQGAQNDPDAVIRLQTALYKEGFNEQSNIDGKYGPKTEAAVRAYQEENRLTADGIAGNETQRLLFKQEEAPPVDGAGAQEEPSPSEGLYAEIQATQQEQQEVSRGYQQQLQEIYDRVVNRPAFSYNINEDALFAQYADAYQRGGQLAMEDAMGQAAALTGGYGSSYGQSVGQQVYQQYMSGLAEKIPALEQQAYSRYQDAGEKLMEQYSLLWQQANDEFDRYNTSLQQQWQNLNYTQGREDLTWEREQAQQDEQYSKLVSLMGIGYQPTEEELAAAGISRAQADAILANYNASRYSAKSGDGNNPTAKLTSRINWGKLPVSNSNELYFYLGDLYVRAGSGDRGEEAVYAQLRQWAETGLINAEAAEQWWTTIVNDETIRNRYAYVGDSYALEQKAQSLTTNYS